MFSRNSYGISSSHGHDRALDQQVETELHRLTPLEEGVLRRRFCLTASVATRARECPTDTASARRATAAALRKLRRTALSGIPGARA